MTTVADVNVTRSRAVMTADAGIEGRERGPFSRTDRPASARFPAEVVHIPTRVDPGLERGAMTAREGFVLASVPQVRDHGGMSDD